MKCPTCKAEMCEWPLANSIDHWCPACGTYKSDGISPYVPAQAKAFEAMREALAKVDDELSHDCGAARDIVTPRRIIAAALALVPKAE